MDIFEFVDFRPFVRQWIQSQPRRGHGQFKKIAEHCGLSTVLISQIFKGERELGLDQAHKLTQFMGLSEAEARFFLLLVQKSRAGTVAYKQFIEKQIEDLKRRSRDLKSRLPQDIELSDSAKAIFHSHWIYTAIRLLSSIEGFQSIESISDRLQISRPKVSEAVEFLLANGLCVLEKGRIRMGPKTTHLEKSSPLFKSRSSAWRLKAIEKIDSLGENEIIYTAPMSLSAKAIKEIHAELLTVISSVVKKVESSPSEKLACLNLDWYLL